MRLIMMIRCIFLGGKLDVDLGKCATDSRIPARGYGRTVYSALASVAFIFTLTPCACGIVLYFLCFLLTHSIGVIERRFSFFAR
jgi:hypothetical protein